jgi:hypothetical protein
MNRRSLPVKCTRDRAKMTFVFAFSVMSIRQTCSDESCWIQPDEICQGRFHQESKVMPLDLDHGEVKEICRAELKIDRCYRFLLYFRQISRGFVA